VVRKLLREERGQTTVEYILLLAAIVSFFLIIGRGLKGRDLTKALTKPLTEDFAFAYKYGHPKARGYDEGAPRMHPRAGAGEDPSNFRIFISPRTQ
jgi:Flp pilus assembly pilin Flp